jgi:hypothetical protein
MHGKTTIKTYLYFCYRISGFESRRNYVVTLRMLRNEMILFKAPMALGIL